MGKGLWDDFVSDWQAHRRVVVTSALLIALVGVVLIIMLEDREQRPRSSAVPNNPTLKKQAPRKLRIRGPVMVGIPWGSCGFRNV